MQTHDLKIQKQFYDRIREGSKSFEVRRHDRDFQVGDELILDLVDDDGNYVEGCDPIIKRISYILRGGNFGIDEDYSVLGLVNDTQMVKLLGLE